VFREKSCFCARAAGTPPLPTGVTLDAPLIAIEKPACYAFHNELPDTGKGAWVNLFNNQWGTNFPMWNEGDARFRFVVERSAKELFL